MVKKSPEKKPKIQSLIQSIEELLNFLAPQNYFYYFKNTTSPNYYLISEHKYIMLLLFRFKGLFFILINFSILNVVSILFKSVFCSLVSSSIIC